MKTNSKIYQLKQIVKQIAVLQRTIKAHRKTVNFKGEKRETIELVTYQAENGKYLPRKTKVYLTPSNAQCLLNDSWGWRPDDDKSDHVSMSRLNIVDLGDKLSFSTTQEMAWIYNEAYALLRYERKTKKNEQLESRWNEVNTKPAYPHTMIKKIMDYFRDEEDEQKAQ
jgi:hypothetical protein